MKIQYQLTFKDYLEFNKTYQSHNISFFWMRLLWIFLGILFIFSRIVELVISNIAGAIIWLTIGLLFCFGYKPFLQYQAAKLCKKQPYFGTVTTLEIIANCLILTKPNIKVEYQWSYYQYFIETENLFVLQEMESVLVVLIIPKNAFESKEQVYELRKLLKNNITKFE